MAFMKTKNACDNCGKDLEEVDEAIKEGKHEFCSADCREEYQEEHDHEDEEERNVCEFC